MTEPDIQELQVKVAFLEDSLSKLSDEFFIQQREFEDLKAKYADLVAKMRGMQNDESGVSEALDERPPHY